MKSNEILKIPSLQVEQFTEKKIYISKMSFVDLRRIALFTHREPLSFDPYDEDYCIDHDCEKQEGEMYYQRLVNDDRTKGIYKFLLEEINNKVTGELDPLGAFPTSMILALDADEESENVDEHLNAFLIAKKEMFNGPGTYIDESDDSDIANLYIPTSRNALIVDGQHRIAGMMKLLKDAENGEIKVGRKTLDKIYKGLSSEDVIRELNSFEFVCTILVGFDMWEQGRIFADVNFNQKPVNKSLYYDIFGAFPDPNKNEIFLSHMLAMHLNNSDKSVLKNRFKMLGRGEGLFSQAFFVEAILPFFRGDNIWSDIPYDFMNDGKKYSFLPKFFSAYFGAIKEVFSDYWPNEDQNTARKYRDILLKTTGMGALIKIIPFVYDEISESIDPEECTSREIKREVVKVFSMVEDGGAEYFSVNSEFAGSGSQGMLGKLFKRIAADLDYKI